MNVSSALSGKAATAKNASRFPLPGLAALATLAFLLIYAAGGFSTLHIGRGDNDSMMRMVQVRDLLGGQNWFDLHQYRMGGGILMHWSRLVDAPIAGLIVLGSMFGAGPELAEQIAATAWPLLLFFAALTAILFIARRFAGEGALLPTLIVSGASLYYIGIFGPGAIDHHNVQLVLTLAMLAGLVAGENRLWPSAGAGACAALMLAVGMETAPYVAVGGLCAALLFLFRGENEARTALGFGFGFGTAAAAVFLLTVPASAWSQPACDAYSVVQFVLAALGGFGLAAVAASRSLLRTIGHRAAALALLGAATAAVLILAYPQCLADPYANVDPWLVDNWLSGISEAQSARDLLRDNPAELVTYYGYGLLGILVLALRVLRQGARRQDMIVACLLFAAFGVTLWQVRGSLFLLPLTAIPLAGWIATARGKAATDPSRRNVLGMVSAWILSFIVTWMAITVGVNHGLAAIRGESAPALAPDGTGACYNKQDYTVLAQQPRGQVLAPTNLGSAILLFTEHDAVAGPYHRNLQGNLLALKALMAEPDAAHAMLEPTGVTLLAWCPGNPESRSLVERAPLSLAASLARGSAPGWLQLVEDQPAGVLQVYKVAR